MTLPIMPKAIAAWLIDNTKLTFEQIGEFCGLHELEINAIADGDVHSVGPMNPILTHQLTKDEIEKGEANPSYRLKLTQSSVDTQKNVKKETYVPMARRENRPAGILWIVKNHPEISDAQVGKLMHSTKQTIDDLRNGTHRLSATLKPQNPITLGLVSELEFYKVLEKAKKKTK